MGAKKKKRRTVKPKPLKKTRAFKSPQRERYAAYPYADAYEIQYESVRDDAGKVVYETAKTRDGGVKLHRRTKKPLYRLDRAGKKIPTLDTTKPQHSKDGQTKKKKVAQLPWGFVVKDTGVRTTWVERGEKIVYAECRRYVRGDFKRARVWIRERELQDQRCLEVAFVDIGQGDGCFVVTPEDKRMVIDAGETDNMRRYLNHRFGTGKGDHVTFEAGIISHPDADHYKGFKEVFHRSNFDFEKIYTNGLMECTVPSKKKLSDGTTLTPLGPRKRVVCDDGVERTVVTRLVTSRSELETFLKEKKGASWIKRSKGRESRKQFPSLLDDACKGKKVQVRKPRFPEDEPEPTLAEYNAERKKNKKPPLVEIKDGEETVWAEVTHDPKATMSDFGMLAVSDKNDKPPKGNSAAARAARDLAAGYMPGYAPRKVNGRDFSIKLLGPVTRRVGGKPALDWLQSVGKTKNGHSVVLLLQYGHVKLLLGGDLNIPSEELLLEHHTGMKCPPEEGMEDAFLEAARDVFQVDVAKSCHHGSSDFTEWFLRALNPIATVISSGDNEPHSHPRSDTLGTIGAHSRSHPRPLIFSTELARSGKDSVKEPWRLKKKIRETFQGLYADEVVDLVLAERKSLEAAAKSATKPKKETKRELRERLSQALEEGIEFTDDNLDEDVERSVAVYGTITAVTDGVRVIIYQKLERKGSHGSYDIYRLEPSAVDQDGNPTGPLMYQSKH